MCQLTKKQADKRRLCAERILLAKELLGGECARCGVTEGPSISLEFDHIDPTTKAFHVSEADRRWEVWIEEVYKCQLLCEECHKEKTLEHWMARRQHGTGTMYTEAKCKCEKCKAWSREYHRKWRAQRRAAGVVPTPGPSAPAHGTKGRYEYYQCRCSECREGARLRRAANKTARMQPR